MVLIAASLGVALYALLGLRAQEAAVVGGAALALMAFYNAVSAKMRQRSDVSTQIADLSRGTTDLARQAAEFGRRLASVELRLNASESRTHNQVGPLAGEVNELGALVRQLAMSVSAQEDRLEALAAAPPLVAAPPVPIAIAPAAPTAPPVVPAAMTPVPVIPAQPGMTADAIPSWNHVPSRPAVPSADLTATIRSALEHNRIDLYLQPLVTLPQRKVRYYEAVSRLRDDKDAILAGADFIDAAEQAGLMPRLDHAVLFRCVQVLRRLLTRNKDIGLFCNMSVSTLRDREVFAQCLDFLDANRALAPSFVLEFRQNTFRHLGPVESEHLAALAQRGFRFSVDNVTDLRIEPRELADRHVRFLKVPAHLLLDPDRLATSEIHPADLSDLLGRFGIDLVAERIEGERSVVDLLDYDVRYGQGFLFSPPRPLRPDAPPAATASASVVSAPQSAASAAPPADPAPTRLTGAAALLRRAGLTQ